MDRPNFKILRSPSLKQRQCVAPIAEMVKLERVLGLTITSNAALSVDCNTGTIAYPAGCVVVLYNPKKGKQKHIFNSSKKTLTCLAFSGDGKHLVTGESGHKPAVRVWCLDDNVQVAEFQGHKFGISCVAFSPNLKYIVSIGTQHDMIVNVWNWKTNIKVASNKVASKVTGVAFSEDGRMFVTVGNRHVKFWYLDASKSEIKTETLPLQGRNGILGEHQNNFFCGVCCGKGQIAESVYAITESGLLCEFDQKRLLVKWVSLRTDRAYAVCLSEEYIFIGYAGGLVRVLSSKSLNFLATLPRPHHLGVDVSVGLPQSNVKSPDNSRFPDTIAVQYDDVNNRLTCVYNDHSLYVWDVTDVHKVAKTHSFLFHSGAIWGVDVCPESSNARDVAGILPPGSFVTCSSDNTIRIWNCSSNMSTETSYKRNIYCNELLKVLYVDPDLNNLLDIAYNPAGKTDKTDTSYQEKIGIRSVRFSPDGKHLASGDRAGNIRVHDLSSMQQIAFVEAHDSEVLCLEYSQPSTGVNLLATASRDRLLHVFDVEHTYGLVQTLDDHLSAITAIKFVQLDGQLLMLSCGADKSLLFRNAQIDPEFRFVLNRHLVSRTTLYDMEIDTTGKFVATACQDRNIRIYNTRTGKQKKCYSGSSGTEGTLLRLELDPSGHYVATSCSDKSLSIYDFFSGELVASMFGHSEISPGIKFLNDLKHVVSVSVDGCIFIWRLPIEFTDSMMGQIGEEPTSAELQNNNPHVRRETFLVPKTDPSDVPDANRNFPSPSPFANNQLSPASSDSGGQFYRFSVGQLPAWAKPRKMSRSNSFFSDCFGCCKAKELELDEIPLLSVTDCKTYENFSHRPVTIPTSNPFDSFNYDETPSTRLEDVLTQLKKFCKISKRMSTQVLLQAHHFEKLVLAERTEVQLTLLNQIEELAREQHESEDYYYLKLVASSLEKTEHGFSVNLESAKFHSRRLFEDKEIKRSSIEEEWLNMLYDLLVTYRWFMKSIASKQVQKKNYIDQLETKRAAKELILADWLKVRTCLKTWTKVWCVLKPGLLLLYKNHKDKSSHWVATALLNSCAAVQCPCLRNEFCFKIFHTLNQSIWAEKGPVGENIGFISQPLPSSYLILRAPSEAAGVNWINALQMEMQHSVSSMVRERHSMQGESPSAGQGSSFPLSKLRLQIDESDCEPHFQLCELVNNTQMNKEDQNCERIKSDFEEKEKEVGAGEVLQDDGHPFQTFYRENDNELEQLREKMEEVTNENKGFILNIIKQVRTGKDLSSVGLPTAALEPRSLLNKLSDYYYHADVLSEAVLEEEPFARMKMVVRWYMSGFYRKPKGLKKPYNPILGEVFRCFWRNPKTGSRTFYIAEQVSHHPPISAFFVSNRQDGFVVSGSFMAKSKFSSNALSAFLEGTARLSFLKHNEDYILTMPYAHCRGLLIGTVTMELGGIIQISCEKTGYHCEIEFKLKPFSGSGEAINRISGKISLGDDTLAQLDGRWDQEIFIKDKSTGVYDSIWNANEVKSSRLHRYTVPIEAQMEFESERLWQHVTESIVKADQFAATTAKSLLEDTQRAATREREAKMEDWIPRFFKKNLVTCDWIYKFTDFRPWDPMNDVVQYEKDFIITTKTRHQMPIVQHDENFEHRRKDGDRSMSLASLVTRMQPVGAAEAAGGETNPADLFG